MSTEMSVQRRRRSSFSQHLQRVFHYDKQNNKRSQSDSCQSYANATNPSIALKEGGIPTERTDKLPALENSSTKPRPYSFGSRNTDLSQSSSRHASQEYYPGSISTRASSANSDAIGESEQRASPTWSGSAKGKEKRASKRLEEERKENERRFRKLEEAELAHEPPGFKRESRRLTKKQPIGRSSRSSSVSSDKSRTSITNFTSLFSSSKNVPRSRSNSKARDQRVSGEWPATEQAQTKDDLETQPAVRPTPINLPERFGTAISNKLALTNNALLPLSAQQSDYMVSELANTCKPSNFSDITGEQNTSLQDDNGVNPCNIQNGKLDSQENKKDDTLALPSTRSSCPQQGLDRLSFSANLNPRKKDNDSAAPLADTANPLLPPWQAATRGENQTPDSIQCPQVLAMPRLCNNDQTGQDSITSEKTPSAVSLSMFSSPIQGGSHKPSPPREFIGGYRYKKFKSSPLAAAPTTSESINMSSESQAKEDSPKPGDCVKRTSTLTSPEKPTSRLISLNQQEKGGKKLRKPPSSSSNTPRKTATGSWADLLGDARSTNRSTQLLRGQSSSKNQESRLQVLSWPDSRSENATYASRQPAEMRFYGGHKPLSNSRGLNGLPSPQSRPVSAKSDPVVRNVLTDRKSDPSQIHPALRVGIHLPQTPINHSSETEAIQPKAESNGVSSRRASQDSHSEDYNTADEVSSIAESYSSAAQNHPLGISSQGHSSSDNDRKASSSDANHIPPVEALGSLKSQTKLPMEKLNNLHQGQSVTKVFVICCQCGFWHDVQSEAYSKLPGMSSSTSHLNTSSPVYEANCQLRKGFPEELKKHSLGPRSNSSINQASRGKPISRFFDLPCTSSSVMLCSQCDHNMSSSCCQGWTTSVHLRKRNF